ncbi:hypothetical protein C241_19442 [Bradyrhizobium lupini HPC(L)]|uniref:Uncharacterized protein n=1 Tax=Bradyrhizobium lupini HPC(L) TaxID=1229491 RepID=A0ABP2RP74_RHILU|nr:hypothetical protein C241_19442 [Bradyrhizobium lupini HPC(L)]
MVPLLPDSRDLCFDLRKTLSFELLDTVFALFVLALLGARNRLFQRVNPLRYQQDFPVVFEVATFFQGRNLFEAKRIQAFFRRNFLSFQIIGRDQRHLVGHSCAPCVFNCNTA